MTLRSFHHAEFPADRLRVERVESVSLCVPAREEAATIARVVGPLVGLREAGVIDQVVVLDDDSRDGTGAIAASLGADVVRPASLLPAFGPVLGKGDAMWRALSVLTGDLLCFVDADSEDFGAHFATGLLGPLICVPGVQFVKGFYRRPFKSGPAQIEPTGGGRVTELMARPLLQAFYPELAAIRQPLAGEFAARRDLLERMAFCTGYGVEIALLIDAAEVGVDAIAQVDLDVRQNRHQPLEDLTPMAEAVLGAVLSRLRRAGRLDGDPGDGPPERPPIAGTRCAGPVKSCHSVRTGRRWLPHAGRRERPGHDVATDRRFTVNRPIGGVPSHPLEAGGSVRVVSLERAAVASCRALVVSDGEIVRAGLRTLGSRAGVDVVGELHSPDGIDEAVQANGAQLVLAAPLAGDGEPYYRALRGIRPGCRALVLLAVPGYRLRAGTLRRRHGLSAVPLDIRVPALRSALHELLGENGNAPLAVEELCVGPGGVLSLREQQVLRELALGIGNETIAERLYLSQATVKSHLRRIYRKLGVRTRAEAVALYVGEFGGAERGSGADRS